MIDDETRLSFLANTFVSAPNPKAYQEFAKSVSTWWAVEQLARYRELWDNPDDLSALLSASEEEQSRRLGTAIKWAISVQKTGEKP